MIELSEAYLSEGPNVVCDGRVSLTFVPSKADRPAAVTVESGSSRVLLDNFAQRSFDPESRTQRPSVEIAKWDDVFIILGLLECVLLNPRHSGELEVVRLFRRADEDSGFHTMKLIEAGERLLLVYESGVMCVDRVSNVMWHSSKCWDDVLLSASEDRICFSGYDDNYCLDVGTGSRRVDGDPGPGRGPA